MTYNQIAYQQHLETKRHNLAGENYQNRDLQERGRHNRMDEALTGERNALTRQSNIINQQHYERSDRETQRSNLARELETNRSNVARENESNRHNLIDEYHAYLNALTNQKNAETNAYAAETNRAMTNSNIQRNAAMNDLTYAQQQQSKAQEEQLKAQEDLLRQQYYNYLAQESLTKTQARAIPFDTFANVWRSVAGPMMSPLLGGLK